MSLTHSRMNILVLSTLEQAAVPRFWGDTTVVHSVGSVLEILGHSPTVASISDEAELHDLLASTRYDLVFPNAYTFARHQDSRYLVRVLDEYKQPYIGTGYPAIRALYKSYWKSALAKTSVPTPAWARLDLSNRAAGDLRAFEDLRFPVIVKPDRGAESFGIRLASNIAELFDIPSGRDVYVVEEFSWSAEYTVTVVGNGVSKHCWPIGIALPAGEPFLSHELKEHHIASTIMLLNHSRERQAVCELACAAFDALQLADWARIDIVRTRTNELMVVDINLLPGLRTDAAHPSYVPVSASLVGGYDFAGLLNLLIECSRRRWQTGGSHA